METLSLFENYDFELGQMAVEIAVIENEDLRLDAFQAAYRLYGQKFIQIYGKLAKSDEVDPFEEACLSFKGAFKTFVERFFPHYCTAEFSAMHEQFFIELDQTESQRGLRNAIAAPRSNAKTTIRTIIKSIYDICFGIEDFIVIMSSRLEPLANDKVRGIRDELDLNQDLKSYFGYGGSFQTSDWGQSDFIAQNRWGHQVRILAASPKSQIRGLLWNGIRPSKIILDDVENSENVESESQRFKMRTWLTSDVSKLGTTVPGQKQLNIDFVGTILHPDSLLANHLNNPGYKAQVYRSVIEFAKRTDLWSQWRDIFIDLSNDSRIEDAKIFFEVHQEAMLDGSRVLWPSGEPYYDLMVQRITEGETAFWKEKQNDPQQSGDFPFRMHEAKYFDIRTDRFVRDDGTYVLFRDIIDIAAFWDPTPGDSTSSDPDYSCCVVVMSDTHGYIYIPDVYIENHDNPTKQIENIAQLLLSWNVTRVGLESNAFQSVLTTNLKEAISDLQMDYPEWSIDVFKVNQSVNKERRILYSLEPLIANHWLQFANDLPDTYMNQMMRWLPIKDSGKDDGPDATEGAIRMLKFLTDARSNY